MEGLHKTEFQASVTNFFEINAMLCLMQTPALVQITPRLLNTQTGFRIFYSLAYIWTSFILHAVILFNSATGSAIINVVSAELEVFLWNVSELVSC